MSQNMAKLTREYFGYVYGKVYYYPTHFTVSK